MDTRQNVQPVLENLVRRHVENAAHFWASWHGFLKSDGDVGARSWRQRLEGHLWGARLAGETARKIAVETARDYPGPGEIFVAIRLAVASGKDIAINEAFALASDRPNTAVGIASATATLSANELAPFVRGWLDAPDWVARLAGVAACRRHRVNPKSCIISLLEDPAAAVRAEAVRLSATLGQEQVALWDDPSPEVRFSTALAMYRFAGQRPQAAAALRRIATEDGVEPSLAADALDRAVMASDPAALREWMDALWSRPDFALLAISAVGVHGHPGSWPWIVASMDRPATAATATAAAADMLATEPVEGRFFTADRRRLGSILGELADETGEVLADVQVFERALETDCLPAAETDPGRMSQRARWLARLRHDPSSFD